MVTRKITKPYMPEKVGDTATGVAELSRQHHVVNRGLDSIEAFSPPPTLRVWLFFAFWAAWKKYFGTLFVDGIQNSPTHYQEKHEHHIGLHDCCGQKVRKRVMAKH